MMYLRQEVSMRQDMVQTPQQILRSELLQLPVMLLEARLKLEVEENPALEFAEAELGVEDLREPGQEDDDDRDDRASDEVEMNEALDDEDNWDEFINEDNLTPYGREASSQSTQELLDIPRPQVLTLQERLAEQMQMDPALDYEDQRIGLEIIGNMGDSGYLECGSDYLAVLLEAPEEKIERVLGRIQRYDPVGICSRNLRECLLVQLEVLADAGHRNSTALAIVRDHFEEFSAKRFESLARVLGLGLDDIRDAFHFISRLNPKPGQGEMKEKENYIIPDLVVERVEIEGDDGSRDEEFVVSLVDGSMPTVRISRAYEEMIRSRKKVDKSVREFVARKVESARWFLSAIQQRRETMLKVMRSIVKLQMDFFMYGKEHIKPLILRDVAEDIEMDISTISRVTNRKYVQTEWGVFELKYFFSERLSMDSGEDVSTKIIRDRLDAIVGAEDKRKPLSDQTIANMLKKEGYNVARRTVQKYREQLRIPVKRLRREI
jgi:RNA polymerase sigma-54 factor